MCFNEFPLFLVMEHRKAVCNGTKAEQAPVPPEDYTGLFYVMS